MFRVPFAPIPQDSTAPWLGFGNTLPTLHDEILLLFWVLTFISALSWYEARGRQGLRGESRAYWITLVFKFFIDWPKHLIRLFSGQVWHLISLGSSVKKSSDRKLSGRKSYLIGCFMEYLSGNLCRPFVSSGPLDLCDLARICVTQYISMLETMYKSMHMNVVRYLCVVYYYRNYSLLRHSSYIEAYCFMLHTACVFVWLD